MKDVYAKLEKIQSDCAVTRTARLIHRSLINIYLNFMGCSAKYICQSIYLLFSIMFGRPETQQEILRLCASCTKTDVALNNLAVRARISPFLFTLISMIYKFTSQYQNFVLVLYTSPRTIKAPASSRSLQLLQSLPQSPKWRRVRSRCFWVMSS